MKKRNTLTRWLVNLLLVAFIAGILFIASGIIITRYYGEELKEYSVNQINEQLEIKISVNEIEFSFFSKFPYTSVVFNDVIAWSGHTINIQEFPDSNVDTLFSAEKIFLQFNIIDLLFGNYHVRRILAINGNLSLLTDSKGNVNFKIFKNNSTQKSKGKNIVYELEAVKLSNFQIDIINIAKHLNSKTYLNDILLKGKFSNNDFSLGTIGSIKLIDLQREGIRYANDLDISARLVMSVNDTIAEITKGELTINNLKMAAKGVFDLGLNKEINIDIQGRNFDLRSLYTSLPISRNNRAGLDIYGRGDLAVNIKGKISRFNVPSIRAVYLLNINKIKYKDKVFQNIDLKGNYSNGRLQNAYSSSINIDKFLLRDFNSDLTGSLSVENLKQPYIKLIAKGKTNAKILNKITNDRKIQNISGYLYPDFQLQSKLTSLKNLDLDAILASGISGKIELENLSALLNDKYPIEELNGEIRFAGESWHTDIACKSNESIIDADLQIDHVFKYLSGQTGTLWINGTVNSEFLDLTPVTKLKEEKQKEGEKKAFNLPEGLYAKIRLNIEKLNAGKFNSSAIQGFLQYKPGFLSLSGMHMNTMEGSISGNSAVIQDEYKNLHIRTQNNLDHININDLFYSFNNFKQDFIVAENIKGFLSGSVDFETVFDSLLNVRKNQILTTADINISSGELIDFEPVKRLSRFVEIEELEHIRFSNLENRILIKDEEVIIPNMDINSSAFNMSVSGKHSFNKQFDYHMKILLSEILAGKAKRSKSENEENWVIEEDGRKASLYLSISGTPENYKIKYDRQEAITNVKEDLKNEKKRLRNILNEEFGLFNNDSTLENQTETGKGQFIIDWGDEQDSLNKKTDKKSNLKEEKLQFEWDDD